jgi:Family of unknown function (DUF5670)
MLWILFLVFLFVWLAGVLISYTVGGWIHVFLVLAAITRIFQVTHRGRPAH